MCSPVFRASCFDLSENLWLSRLVGCGEALKVRSQQACAIGYRSWERRKVVQVKREAPRFVGKFLQGVTASFLLAVLLGNDVLTQIDALVANVYGRTTN